MLSLAASHMHFEQLPADTECWEGVQDEKREGWVNPVQAGGPFKKKGWTCPFLLWFNFEEIQKVTKKVTFKFTFLVVLSLTVNVPFCHEDGAGELCKLKI